MKIVSSFVLPVLGMQAQHDLLMAPQIAYLGAAPMTYPQGSLFGGIPSFDAQVCQAA